jgi:hypothetical protein
MARPITFDETVANNLYQQGKTDSEIAKILGVRKSTIDSWRQRRKLPTNEVEKINVGHSEKRKSYKDALTPIQAKRMNSFLRALAFAGREAVRCGVKPDVHHFMNVWSGRYKTEEETKLESMWQTRDKKLKGVS